MNEYKPTLDQEDQSEHQLSIGGMISLGSNWQLETQFKIMTMRWGVMLLMAFIASFLIGIELCVAQSADQDDLLSTPRGLYLGVKPGEQNYAPGKKLSPRGSVQRIVWIGFQTRRDRAQVFIQTNSRPIFEIAESNPLRVVIDFPNARLHTPNEGRTLDAAFFPTVVRSLKARQITRKLVRLVIWLREPARYRKKTDSKFLHLLFDPPKEPIDVIAEYERETELRMKNIGAIEYKRPN